MSIASLDRGAIEKIVREIVLKNLGGAAPSGVPDLAVSVSARHLHLTDEHVEVLFGPGRKLTPMKPLFQDGFYAAEETVMVVGPRRRMLPSVRRAAGSAARDRRARWSWLLPTRFRWAWTCPCELAARLPARPDACWSWAGRRRRVEAKAWIRAERHVHMNLDHAAATCVKNGDRIELPRTGSNRRAA